MATGKTHDLIAIYTTIPVGLLSACVLPTSLAVIVAGSFFVGGWWLSPDLDTHSNPYKRWGLLRYYWKPYQYLMPHRSPLSHGLVIGTAIRLLYLLALPLACCVLSGQLPGLIGFCSLYWRELLACFAGLELGALAHIAADGMLF